MKYIGKNKFILSSGKEIYANNGIIGISEDSLGIYHGYDGDIFYPLEEWEKEEEKKPYLNTSELKEICLYMENLWKRFYVELEKGEDNK